MTDEKLEDFCRAMCEKWEGRDFAMYNAVCEAVMVTREEAAREAATYLCDETEGAREVIEAIRSLVLRPEMLK